MGRPADWEHCKRCVHYEEDSEYDYCHMCVMETDHFKPKQEEDHEKQKGSAGYGVVRLQR